jgi:hypothetical protein
MPRDISPEHIKNYLPVMDVVHPAGRQEKQFREKYGKDETPYIFL